MHHYSVTPTRATHPPPRLPTAVLLSFLPSVSLLDSFFTSLIPPFPLTHYLLPLSTYAPPHPTHFPSPALTTRSTYLPASSTSLHHPSPSITYSVFASLSTHLPTPSTSHHPQLHVLIFCLPCPPICPPHFSHPFPTHHLPIFCIPFAPQL